MPDNDLAQQLLDAQVRHHLDRLGPDQLADTLTALVDDLLATAGQQQIADLVDADAVTAVITRGLTTIPDSAAVAGVVEMVIEVAKRGPEQQVTLGEVVQREQVEALLDAGLALTPVVEKALDRLTASPLVGTAASRFMGRVAGEVLATNQAIADKIPGLGSLTRLGTSAATKVVGVADKQLEGLMAATVGKGSTFAVRRLNRVVVDTIQDPATRAAALQVWDLIAAERLVGIAHHLTDEQIDGLSTAGQDLAVTMLRHDAVAELAAAIVAGFLEWFGGYTPQELLEQFEVSRADLDADVQRLAPGLLEVLTRSGDLERLLRNQLRPFYASREVAEILGQK